jgi:hypothetical protein
MYNLSFIFTMLLLFFSFSSTNILVISQVYSQSSGLKITPTIVWSDNVDGIFSYCVFEGVVALDTNVDNVSRYCVDPSQNPSLQKLHAFTNDNIDTYQFDQIQTPRGAIKDGTNYSVCVTFAPSQNNAGYNGAESCQTFVNTIGSHPEEPLINLDDAARFF